MAKLLTTDEASERLNIKTATLRVWRMQGKGPKFKKIGALVRYDEAVLEQWSDDQSRTSTSQKAPAQAALA
jgi:predicted site-specific integrase-resolvase